MKRIKKLFRDLKRDGRCGLVAYVTCGDPDPQTTVEVVLELDRAGADCIELGVPFSDPIADGPVIQGASQRALLGGTTVDTCVQIATEIRERSEIPLVAFSYINPIMKYGFDRFAAAASDAGIDALLTTDLPPESSREARSAMHRKKVGMIFLLAPTSPSKRVRLADRASDGFVYYVSTTGVTGTRKELDPELIGRLDEIRGELSNPVAVGFGVSRNEHYEALSAHCDAVVVGSAIVRAIDAGDPSGAAERAGGVVREILGVAGSA